MPKIKGLLREKREKLGYTQQEVADLLKIKQPHWFVYENREKIPNIDRMDEIADVLELTREEVYKFFRKQK